MSNYHEPSNNFVAIDVEYADSEQNICQFGLVVVQDGRVVEPALNWIIQPPENRYEQKQMNVHHMTPADTVNAPTFKEVWPEIEPYLRNAEIWAHNAASAEESALRKCLERAGIECFPYVIYDSMRLYIRPDRNQWNSGNGLRACLYAVGLPCNHHHDAGADAMLCAQIIIAHQQGVVPDWQKSDCLMAEYEASKKTELNAKEKRYQAQQLELFGDVVSSSSSSDSDDTFKPTFFHKDYDSSQDGTDNIDVSRLNTNESNPLYGASIVLTGFFHIKRNQLRDALKKMGAVLKPTITKNVQAVLLGERNVGPSKMVDLKTLIHNGYNIARISGDADLDRLLYDSSLTPQDFAIPTAARKDLNFTVGHFRKHHHTLAYPVNTIASRELFFPSTGFMGRLDIFCQMCGNLGAFGNWDYNSQVNLVVLPNASVEALQKNEKDEVIRGFEAYYNSQRAVTFDAEFITERDILKFVRERIVRCNDDVTGELYKLYLQSANIDPEKDYKYGLAVAREAYEKEMKL
jgi:DNA polymerase-3 subunit epsilon